MAALGAAMAQQQFHAVLDGMSYEEMYEYFGGEASGAPPHAAVCANPLQAFAAALEARRSCVWHTEGGQCMKVPIYGIFTMRTCRWQPEQYPLCRPSSSGGRVRRGHAAPALCDSARPGGAPEYRRQEGTLPGLASLQRL